MIVRIAKKSENGSWNIDGEFIGEVVYQVITSSTDGVEIFYDKAGCISAGLPVCGSSYRETDILATSINFERAEERNFRDNGHLGDVCDAYAVWDYTVTYGEDMNGESTLADQSFSNKKAPTSISVAPKVYEIYDDKKVALTEKDSVYSYVKNTAGSPMFSTRHVRNIVLSITYKTNRFDASFITKYTGSINSTDMVLCGIPITEAQILSLSYKRDLSKREYDVSAEIEIKVEHDLLVKRVLSKGFYAYIRGKGASSKSENTFRIQRMPIPSNINEDIQPEDGFPGRHYTSDGKPTVFGAWGVSYPYSEDEILLDSFGCPSPLEATVMSSSDVSTAIANGTLSEVLVTLASLKDWKPLGLPELSMEDGKQFLNITSR